jgi:hypothetical protein
MIVEEGKHYLYRHIRLDNNQVFYIGIGTKNKKNIYKRAYSDTSRNTYWKHITNNTDYKIDIVLESDDYEFIKEKEKEFIALYGRKDLHLGTLVNLTDGGDGTIGRKHTKEAIKKISLKNKGHKYNLGIKKTEEHILKLKEYKKTEEHRLKISLSKTGVKMSDDFKKKVSIATKAENNPMYGKKHSDETKKKIGEKSIGRKPFSGKKHSDETKNKISSNAKQRYSDIENHPRYGKKHSDETRKKLSNKCIFTDLTTNEKFIFDSMLEGAKTFGLNYSACSMVIRGVRNSTGNYKVEYLNKNKD